MSKLAIKTYIVCQRLNVADHETGDNVRILDVFLTAKDANGMVDRTPGTFVEKRVASKSAP